MAIIVETSTELGEILRPLAVEHPSRADRERLHAYVQQHGIEVMAALGDQTSHVIESILHTSHRKHWGLYQAAHIALTEMEKGLGYEQSPQLEKLIIRQIALAWLRYHDVEHRYQMVCEDNPTITQMEHWDKRLSMAQRRYLRAVEALARVRKLNVNLQVNIGQNQIIARPSQP